MEQKGIKTKNKTDELGNKYLENTCLECGFIENTHKDEPITKCTECGSKLTEREKWNKEQKKSINNQTEEFKRKLLQHLKEQNESCTFPDEGEGYILDDDLRGCPQ